MGIATWAAAAPGCRRPGTADRGQPSRKELEDLFVDPAHMRRGIATDLIQHLVGVLKERGVEQLEVTGNPHALGFYHAAGFTDCGVAETDFYDAPRLVLKLG